MALYKRQFKLLWDGMVTESSPSSPTTVSDGTGVDEVELEEGVSAGSLVGPEGYAVVNTEDTDLAGEEDGCKEVSLEVMESGGTQEE